MTAPNRWRDDGPDDVRALLQQARPSRSMKDSERAAMHRHVSRLAAVPVGLGIVFWLKGLALGAGVGAVVIAAAVVAQRPTAPPPSVGPAVATPPVAASARPSAPLEAEVVEVEPAASSRRKANAVASVDPPDAEAPVDSLAAEAALLEQARSAVGGDPARALALTQQHATKFPKGQLGVEREIVAIEALRAMGRSGEAKARAERLLERSRGSLYEERIKNLIP